MKRFSNIIKKNGIRHFSAIPKNPIWKANTVVCVCAQGSQVVVERFGRFHRVEQPGFFFAIPFLERLTKVDMREHVLQIDPQMAITKDNVKIELSGSLYLNFVDPYKALYGAVKPLVATVNLSQAIMRSCVGRMELDDIFSNRTRLNYEIKAAITEPTAAWGISVNNYEIRDIVPEEAIAKKMELQAAAERERRRQQVGAEADKQQTVLNSEAQRARDVNESEGLKIKLINEAEGQRQRLILEAEGRAEAIVKEAEGKKREIEMLAQAISTPEGMQAVQYSLSKEYFAALAKLGEGQGTIVVPSNLADMSSLLVPAKKILEMSSDKREDLVKPVIQEKNE